MSTQTLALLDISDRVLLLISSTIARLRVSRGEEAMDRLREQVKNLSEVIAQLEMLGVANSSLKNNVRFLILHLKNNLNPNLAAVSYRIKNLSLTLAKLKSKLESTLGEPNLERVRRDLEWLREYVMDVKDTSINPVITSTLSYAKDILMRVEPPEPRPDFQDLCLDDLAQAERLAVENNKSGLRRTLIELDSRIRRWILYLQKPEVAEKTAEKMKTDETVFRILRAANGEWLTISEIRDELQKRTGRKLARSAIEYAVKSLIKQQRPIQLNERVRPKRARYLTPQERRKRR